MSFPSYHRYVGTNQQVFDGVLDFVKTFKKHHALKLKELMELMSSHENALKQLDIHLKSNDVHLIATKRNECNGIQIHINKLNYILEHEATTKLYLDLYKLFCENEAH